jgi:hypothetical protein
LGTGDGYLSGEQFRFRAQADGRSALILFLICLLKLKVYAAIPIILQLMPTASKL